MFLKRLPLFEFGYSRNLSDRTHMNSPPRVHGEHGTEHEAAPRTGQWADLFQLPAKNHQISLLRQDLLANLHKTYLNQSHNATHCLRMGKVLAITKFPSTSTNTCSTGSRDGKINNSISLTSIHRRPTPAARPAPARSQSAVAPSVLPGQKHSCAIARPCINAIF